MRSDRRAHAFVLVFFFLTGCASAQERMCLREACYSVDVMRTDAGRAQGLMFRKGLGQGKGMFFVFEREDIYRFWMKNMLFAIDIIWLDKDKRVIHIASDVPPCGKDPCPLYGPSVKALYVLEIPDGDALRHGIRVGDVLR